MPPDIATRIRLLRSQNIGPVSYYQLMRRFGSAEAALAALPDLVQRGGGKSVRLASVDAVAREMEQVARAGAQYLCHDDPTYPALLGYTDNAPPIFTYAGRVELLALPMLAMVGARNASAAACKFARALASELVAQGYCVVSGLARGIDTAAHVGALTGNAATIGVIASGIDISYPPENSKLQRQIAETGLLIAEQPPGTEPLARHFPYRNRIIAGLARGTLVVEAAPRSGSLITARLAAEAGREVLAIPGSPLDPRSRGCNDLIRGGATLVQSAADVIEALSAFDTSAVREPAGRYFASDFHADFNDMHEPDGDERSRLIDLLSMVAVSVDELVRQSHLPAPVVQMLLLELEIAGRLQRHAGGKVSLK